MLTQKKQRKNYQTKVLGFWQFSLNNLSWLKYLKLSGYQHAMNE